MMNTIETHKYTNVSNTGQQYRFAKQNFSFLIKYQVEGEEKRLLINAVFCLKISSNFLAVMISLRGVKKLCNAKDEMYDCTKSNTPTEHQYSFPDKLIGF